MEGGWGVTEHIHIREMGVWGWECYRTYTCTYKGDGGLKSEKGSGLHVYTPPPHTHNEALEVILVHKNPLYSKVNEKGLSPAINI